MKPLRTITFVARQTGLSIHAIRVWEKRYGAVRPVRAANNRRLYTEEDVERLRLLHEATLAGHAISQVANASIAELASLVRESSAAPAGLEKKRRRQIDQDIESLMRAALAEIVQFDARRFSKVLEQAA
ncbi:MAG: MerR family transcriptional regulator, partial [Verrucomicrobiota bacterium]|nr:MerR family transcriptional regulator [Verrucomicrobiota bacterium]